MGKSYKSEMKKGYIGLGAMVVLGAVVVAAAEPAYQALSKIGRVQGTESIYQAGAYEASADGFGGPVTAVVTVSDKNIETLTVTGEGETPEIGGKALTELPMSILKMQTTEVDGIAGATITSDAVKKAVDTALAQARGEELPAEEETEEEVVVNSDVNYQPGTYEGSADGFGGPVSVTVTVSDSSIETVEAVGDDETPEIGGRALTGIPEAILKKQTADVDSVSGATITSDAIKDAVKQALAQAEGGEAEAPAEEETEEEAVVNSNVNYQPGTYEASADGFGGSVSVTVTVSDSGIETVEAVGDDETPEIGGRALTGIPEAILKKQTADVDSVSGATITSDAIKDAVKQALAQAEGGEALPAEEETEEEAAVNSNVNYQPGTYEGSAEGFGGPVSVTVTVSDSGIETVEAVGDDETPEIGGRALTGIPEAILKKQTADVDSIAGATITSEAVLDAVKQALAQAEGGEAR